MSINIKPRCPPGFYVDGNTKYEEDAVLSDKCQEKLYSMHEFLKINNLRVAIVADLYSIAQR